MRASAGTTSPRQQSRWSCVRCRTTFARRSSRGGACHAVCVCREGGGQGGNGSARKLWGKVGNGRREGREGGREARGRSGQGGGEGGNRGEGGCETGAGTRVLSRGGSSSASSHVLCLVQCAGCQLSGFKQSWKGMWRSFKGAVLGKAFGGRAGPMRLEAPLATRRA
eukprot:236959-Chlamydomonas_euryale.AAC.1